MPTPVDEETGQAHTDHSASQSPLANESSLLGCHEARGIDLPRAMVQMAKGLQDGVAERGEAPQVLGLLGSLCLVGQDGILEGNAGALLLLWALCVYGASRRCLEGLSLDERLQKIRRRLRFSPVCKQTPLQCQIRQLGEWPDSLRNEKKMRCGCR